MIKPMEPVYVEQLPLADNLLYQVKWDGIRVLAKINKGTVTLHTRHGKLRTHIYPEVASVLATQFPHETVYFDGEVVVIHQGKADFFLAAKRDRLKTPSKIERASRQMPVHYIIFDLLQYGDWLLDRPCHERLSLLKEVVTPSDTIQICPTTTDGKALFTYTKEHGWEGIVCKEKQGLYHCGEKHPTWKKVKHYQTISATILGVTLKSGLVYSLLLGRREKSGWRYIGRVSSGLSTKEKQLLTHYSRLLSMDEPIATIPAFREEEIRWFVPTMEVEVRFLEWTPEAVLRNPVIIHLKKTAPKGAD
jgi:bifunctional non-homologous end joining protein LigD